MTIQGNLFRKPSQQIKSLGGERVLSPEDVPQLSEATQRVRLLMSDGQWHTATEIIERSGQREGLRRMRELRRLFLIQRRREQGREFSYRLIVR